MMIPALPPPSSPPPLAALALAGSSTAYDGEEFE